jgi:hypothetical protein
MAYVNVTNWLLRRSAGALFNLQKTPYDKTVNGIDANPKKTQNSATVSHSREFLTNWPADTVFKISASSLAMNKLELETTSTSRSVSPVCADVTALYEIYLNAEVSAIYQSAMWSGGNEQAYVTMETAFNIWQPEYDSNGNLIAQTWQVHTRTTTWDSSGTLYITSDSIDDFALAPNTLGTGAVPHIENGSGTGFFAEPNNSVWAKFTGLINAKDFIEEYPGTGLSAPMAAFCMRSDADSAHTLTPYIQGGVYSNKGLFVTAPSTSKNNIFSYRHTTSDKANGYLQKHDTTCKWYYTPNACEDCWYEGKVIKVRVAYKKAAITYTYMPATGTGDESYNTWTIGTWASHSTVDYDLTIPAGYTRQQLGSTFTVPVVDGYIVTIDDIKFISVT